MTDYTRGTNYGGAQGIDSERGPADIESEIRQTRDRMGEDIGAIGEKLRPERIKQRAKDAVSRKGNSLLRTARENPFPTAMVAWGMSMLIKARGKQRDTTGNGSSRDTWSGDETAEGVKERATEMVGEGKEKVERIAERAGEQAKRTGNTVQHFFENNPLIAGAAAMVLGAAVGALVPQTKQENRVMGPARDELVEQAKGVAQHAKGEFEQKMSER